MCWKQKDEAQYSLHLMGFTFSLPLQFLPEAWQGVEFDTQNSALWEHGGIGDTQYE